MAGHNYKPLIIAFQKAGFVNQNFSRYLVKMKRSMENQVKMYEDLPEGFRETVRTVNRSTSRYRIDLIQTMVEIAISQCKLYESTAEPVQEIDNTLHSEIRAAFGFVGSGSSLVKFLEDFHRVLAVDAVMLKVSSESIACGVDDPGVSFDCKMKDFNEVHAGHIQALSLWSILSQSLPLARK